MSIGAAFAKGRYKERLTSWVKELRLPSGLHEAGARRILGALDALEVISAIRWKDEVAELAVPFKLDAFVNVMLRINLFTVIQCTTGGSGFPSP